MVHAAAAAGHTEQQHACRPCTFFLNEMPAAIRSKPRIHTCVHMWFDFELQRPYPCAHASNVSCPGSTCSIINRV